MKNLFERIFSKLRTSKTYTETYLAWKKSSKKLSAKKIEVDIQRILIFPSDLKTITGALGDDAMISATVEQYKQGIPDLIVDMLCRESATDIVRAKGFNPIILPPERLQSFPDFIAELLNSKGYRDVIALGADIMDGYYGSEHPAMALIATDLAVKIGANGTILGASFNDSPRAELARFFNNLDPSVHLNLRDKTSFDRVNSFASVSATLVADSAFLLTPGRVPDGVTEWVQQQKSQGNQVIGVNAHPMLIKNASDDEVHKIIDSTVSALVSTAQKKSVSFLLLPHDYRGEHGDARCLHSIYKALQMKGVSAAFYLDGEHRAADLKAVAGLLDGVITGRMHLAIATLGMGVPVLSLTYQDKFEGLYRHFDLPSELLLSTVYFDTPDKLADSFIKFIDDLPLLAERVVANKPTVMALSQKNFGSI